MKRKLLVVDDDRSVAESLRKLLEAEGFEVFTAWDAPEAIEQFKANPIDLVILDINLGTDNGWAVFQTMVDMNPFVPTVVITAEWGQHNQAVAAGVEALIEKPIDVPSFLKLVNDLLEEESESRRRRVRGEENYCRYLAKDYATTLKMLQERSVAPLNLSLGTTPPLPKPRSKRERRLPVARLSVVADPTRSDL